MTDEIPTVTIVHKDEIPQTPPPLPEVAPEPSIVDKVLQKLDVVESKIAGAASVVGSWFTKPKVAPVEDPKMIPAPTKAQLWWSHFRSAVAAGLVAFSSFNVGAVLPKIDQAKQAAVQETVKQTAVVDTLKQENAALKQENAKLIVQNTKPILYKVSKDELVIRHPDGSFEVRHGGSIGWRYNNPGKIAFGAFAKANGAIGFDGPLAVFSTYDDGFSALSNLMFGDYSDFKKLTVENAIRKFAPTSDGYDQHAYVKAVLKVGKYTRNTVLGTMTVDDRTDFLNAIQNYEKFAAGDVKRYPDEDTLNKDTN